MIRTPAFQRWKSTVHPRQSNHDRRHLELDPFDHRHAFALPLTIFRFSLDSHSNPLSRHHYAAGAFWNKPPALPEHVYLLDLNTPPDQRDADPHGSLLLYSPIHGWMVTALDEVEEAFHENGCTHWTYTPPIPPHARNYLR